MYFKNVEDEMQVKIIVEIQASIPGEFQDDKLATKLLKDELIELLDIGTEYDKYDQPTVMFTSLNINEYIPGKGKL
jgi:hypothetical protein